MGECSGLYSVRGDEEAHCDEREETVCMHVSQYDLGA